MSFSDVFFFEFLESSFQSYIRVLIEIDQIKIWIQPMKKNPDPNFQKIGSESYLITFPDPDCIYAICLRCMQWEKLKENAPC